MYDKWDLSPLYKGFDDPAFASDMQQLKESCAQLNAFAATLKTAEPLAGLRRGIELMEQIAVLLDKLAAYPSLRQSTNTRDQDAASQQGRVRSVVSGIASAQAAFREWAAKLPDLAELVESDELLRQYTFYFRELQSGAQYQLEGNGEEIMARMSMSGTAAWNAMRGLVTSTAKVHYRGEVTNLSAIRNLARDPDPQVRKEAYEAELAASEAIEDPVAHAMNAIKLETISECKLRGYESPLDYTLVKARLSKETLEAMFAAMDEFLPKFWQYLKAKAKLLGHEKGLPWYDLFAPVGDVSLRYTPETARKYLVDLFAQFHPELSALIDRAFDEEWIDFYPREGKRDGAFCSSVRSMSRSWILTNFDGSFSAVSTLAHELGHAYHNQCIKDHRVLNKRYSMPVAETASTFNECVTFATAIEKATEKTEKLALLEAQLKGECQIICDIYSRFRFEDEVFKRREEEFLSAKTLCDIMIRAQKACYGDGLDHNYLHPYMWLCKPHYYSATYYNYPYAFGGLFARGLYAQYQKEGAAFVPKYKKLLYTTTVASAEEAAKVAGLDLTDREFWRSALQSIAEEIDLFCALAEE